MIELKPFVVRRPVTLYMLLRIAKLAIFAIMIATVGSLMVGSSVFTEQPVKAQNMTDSAGNMPQSYDNGSGSISAMKRPREP